MSHLLCSSRDWFFSHLQSRLPLAAPERAIWLHSDLQCPNLPQAKQFPGLDGRSTKERLNKFKQSRWPRQELSPEEALWLGGAKRELEGRKTEETCLAVFLVEADFKAFSALSSARRIFFPSSSSSASSCCEYSSTVFQPNSDLSANRINFCLFVRSNVPSVNDSFAFSTAFVSRCVFASSRESCSFELNLYWISFPLRLNDFGSSLLNFFTCLSCSSAASALALFSWIAH